MNMRTLALSLFAAAMVAAAPSHAVLIEYTASLSGPGESPPNASPGTGSAIVDFDATANTMHVHVSFAGLLGTTTASHIHAPTAAPGTGTAGVATQTPTFINFPLGVTSGTYDHTFDLLDLATYNNPTFVTANGGTAAGAEAALGAALAAVEAYLNIHTSAFPNGEIRGFLLPVAAPVAVPEPGSLALLAIASLALVAGGARRR
jgi:hypothetical protein